MSESDPKMAGKPAKDFETARDLEKHLQWLDTFTSGALGVLATASGIYTYLGVSTLLEDSGVMSFFAAIAYSLAVSVGIFVFWCYMLRLLPSMRKAAGFIGLSIAAVIGSLAIVAMSSWLNAAALAGSAAVELHLSKTVRDYQAALEQSHDIALSGQALEREVRRARESFEALAVQEKAGKLSGAAGEGAVFRLLKQKTEELSNLEDQIREQQPLIQQAFEDGNEILARMRALTVAPGAVDLRSVEFSEESVRLAGVVLTLNQYSLAPLLARAADDLASSIVLPDLDGSSGSIRNAQSATMDSILKALKQRSKTLKQAADEALAKEPPVETGYNAITAADAVIKYAEHFIPSWAGAIAIDLLPGVLVFMLAITQAAIRSGRDGAHVDETLTLADFKVAMSAIRDVETIMGSTDEAIQRRSSRSTQELPPSE